MVSPTEHQYPRTGTMVQNGLASTEGWNQREHDTGEEATGLFSCDLEWLVSARWAGGAAGWGEKKIGRENSFKQRKEWLSAR